MNWQIVDRMIPGNTERDRGIVSPQKQAPIALDENGRKRK